MKARHTIIKNIIGAAILATTLLAPVAAENRTEVVFVNGEAYLQEVDIAQPEFLLAPDADMLLTETESQSDVRVTFANGNVYLQDHDLPTTESINLDGADLNHALTQEILKLTNAERASHGLAPLALHQALEGAALDHSQEMRDLNYFSHTSPTAGKATTRQRVNQYGVNPQMVAENIFECSGYDLELTAKFAVEAFMQSPGHRQNVLSPMATHIGVGLVEVNGTVSVTQVFAAGI